MRNGVMYGGIDIDLGHCSQENNTKLEQYEAELRKQEQERLFSRYKKSGVPSKFFDQRNCFSPLGNLETRNLNACIWMFFKCYSRL